MSKVTVSILLGMILAVIAGLIFLNMPVHAFGEQGLVGGVDSALGAGMPTNLASGEGSIVRRIINLLLYAVGVISVVMLIVGGFRYVVSGGQKESVTAAKNTILYAIVGLVIAIFAYAIVKFVIGAAIGNDSVTDI